MLDTLQEIILNGQEAEYDAGVPRRIDMRSVSNKATVCMGVRRSGKSTLMFQVVRCLLKGGVPRQNILFLNFFDDRLHGLRQEGLGIIPEAYFSLYPEKKNTDTVYCFFDEIQAVPGWEPFVDRLMRTEKCEVYITGSSSRMLSREIATQMRGRALSHELFPFSFREFLDYKALEAAAPRSTRQRLLIQQAFEEYMETGGFPEVAGLDQRLRIRTHQEYFNAMLFRDLIERHNIPHPRAVSDLAHRLMDNIGSRYSINKLTGYLKSLGHKAPKDAVGDYLEWFEDAYVFFTVRIFDASRTRANLNPKKVYGIDHALATSVGPGILRNTGHLLENAIFLALRRITPNISYVRTRDGREVDFVARIPHAPPLLVQVCESMEHPQTREREIRALDEAMASLDLSRGVIVTRREQEQIQVEAGTIEAIPAWRFLLDIEEEGVEGGATLPLQPLLPPSPLPPPPGAQSPAWIREPRTLH